jgi:hypothetical protein
MMDANGRPTLRPEAAKGTKIFYQKRGRIQGDCFLVIDGHLKYRLTLMAKDHIHTNGNN